MPVYLSKYGMNCEPKSVLHSTMKTKTFEYVYISFLTINKLKFLKIVHSSGLYVSVYNKLNGIVEKLVKNSHTHDYFTYLYLNTQCMRT